MIDSIHCAAVSMPLTKCRYCMSRKPSSRLADRGMEAQILSGVSQPALSIHEGSNLGPRGLALDGVRREASTVKIQDAQCKQSKRQRRKPEAAPRRNVAQIQVQQAARLNGSD